METKGQAIITHRIGSPGDDDPFKEKKLIKNRQN